MRAGFASVMGVLLLGSVGFSGGDAAKEDSDKMQGTWQFVAHEMNGKAASKDDLKKMSVTIKGDNWSVKVEDKVVQAGTQTLDPAKKPKALDAKVTEGEGKGGTMLGIYKMEGDTMTVCFDPAGKARPKAFKSEADSGYFLATVKKMAK